MGSLREESFSVVVVVAVEEEDDVQNRANADIKRMDAMTPATWMDRFFFCACRLRGDVTRTIAK